MARRRNNWKGIALGQRWRRRADGALIVIRQIHRKDGEVQYVYEAAYAETNHPRTHCLPLVDLRNHHDLLVDCREERD